MQKIISFIIPSYNVEQYLRKVLDSFLLDESKTLQNMQEKIEVIVVDDGSSDKTAEIAREYVERKSEIFHLLQKENGGHGSAINEGTRIANGKYLKVIDADDWVVTENLPELIRKLEASEADVVLNPFHMIDMQTKKKEIRCMYLEDYERTYTLQDVMDNWKSFDRCMTFHGIMYKRDFYEAYRHELPEKIFYEDQEYAAIPCCHAKTILAIDLFLYQYLVGNGNQSVASHNQLKRISHIEQVVFQMLKYCTEHTELEDEGKSYLLKKTEGAALSYYVIANLVNPNKNEGRKWSRAFNCEIKKLKPQFYESLKRKYVLYAIFNRLGIGMNGYEKTLNSSFYNFVRKNHKREME